MYRLRWLRDVARMPDTRHPMKLLVGWLLQKCPAHGVRLRWQDKIHQDLKKCGISKSSWYIEAQDHTRWRTTCTKGLNQHVMAPSPHKPFVCTTCHQSFQRQQDISRHKCIHLHLSLTIIKRLVTASSGQHHLRMTGFKFMYVYMHVCIYVCMHVSHAKTPLA